MGKIKCSRHGDQGIMLVCSHAREALLTGGLLSNVLAVRFGGELLHGIDIIYPLCRRCINDVGLAIEENQVFDWDEWFDRLPLEPVSGVCCQKALKDSGSAAS